MDGMECNLCVGRLFVWGVGCEILGGEAWAVPVPVGVGDCE